MAGNDYGQTLLTDSASVFHVEMDVSIPHKVITHNGITGKTKQDVTGRRENTMITDPTTAQIK